MIGTQKERWLTVVLTGYVAWVVPYDIRLFTSFVSQFNPGMHTFITLASITLVCGALTVILFQAGSANSLKLGLFVAIPWLLIALVCDFGLDTYYRSWEPDILAYGLSRVWHFIFVPVGSILAGGITQLIWKPKEAVTTPVTVVQKFRK